MDPEIYSFRSRCRQRHSQGGGSEGNLKKRRKRDIRGKEGKKGKRGVKRGNWQKIDFFVN